MKKIATLITFLAAFVLAFSFSSCTNSTDSKKSAGDERQNYEERETSENTEASDEELLIGEWELVSQTNSDGTASSWKLEKIKLYEDGTCSVNNEMGTWKVADDELMVLGSYGGRFWNSDAIVGEFSCDGETLCFFEAQIDAKDNSVNLIYEKSE